jgi:2,3-bisphosphoglycerate-dependent phosphoglycerate mutase
MELLLIRHALPVRREVLESAADPDLSEAGLEQARLLADYLSEEEVHAIYASPMQRAIQTSASTTRSKASSLRIRPRRSPWCATGA